MAPPMTGVYSVNWIKMIQRNFMTASSKKTLLETPFGIMRKAVSITLDCFEILFFLVLLSIILFKALIT